eukprot:COSAG02_NODE_4845_length_4912_cov_11.302514_7_plen_446_part_00
MPVRQLEGDHANLTPPASGGSASTVVAAERGRYATCAQNVLCCCCTDVLGGLAGYVLCLYGLVILAHHFPTVGLPLLAVLPPLLLLAMCTLRHLDGLNGCQLVLTTACAVLWMSPLLLLQWALATTHVPTMLFALDSRCATCIEAHGGYDAKYLGLCSCWGKTFVQAFVLSAFPEELLKLVAVLGVANRTHISRPGALVMYAMGASAGFAAVENILYVIGASTQKDGDTGDDSATTTALARAALSIPLHLTCGALIGVGLARWRWLSKRGTESRHLWTLVNRAEEGSVEPAHDAPAVAGLCRCCTGACYGGLPCRAGLTIVIPAMLIHTVYDGVLMAPYRLYQVELGSPSHIQQMYIGSGVTIMVGLLGVYILSLPLNAPGVAEQDDTLEPDEERRVGRWPARRREGVNLADCVYASILCCLEDDFYEEEDARLQDERARALSHP